MRLRRAFLGVVAAQFFSSLADNALLVVAISVLLERAAPTWMTPALRGMFCITYLCCAPIAGRVADRFPKGRVMLVTSIVKLIGCALLLAQVHPLLAYALVGAGAAVYGPAKYGILPELLPPSDLVAGNAWIEITTVLSILLGLALGSVLMSRVQSDTVQALLWLLVLYAGAAVAAGLIQAPCAGVIRAVVGHARDGFFASQKRLWCDRQAGTALAVTALFWAVAAVLQFLVLRWGQQIAHLSLAAASLLQLPVAVGMIGGAVMAGRWITLSSTLRLTPIGLALGTLLLAMTAVQQVLWLVLLLTAVGVLAGLLLVPMNALLQQRGALLMGSGQSIAVQSFAENLASVVLLAGYAASVAADWSIDRVALVAGLLVLGGVGGIIYVAGKNGGRMAASCLSKAPSREG